MRKILMFCLLLASCGGKKQETKSLPADGKTAKLDSLFHGLEKEGKLNGVVLIARGDTVLYQHSFGMADEAAKRPLNDSSVFELASVSKQFTAMAIVLLREQGKLKFTDSLRQYFPELPYMGITIEHLLHHTSGLPDYMDLVIEHTADDSIATNRDMIRLLAEQKPKISFLPGEKWEYSNTGYAILASIIEKVSGTSYADFLSQNIFRPLGMRQTEVFRRRYEKRTISNYALGYVKDERSGKYILPDSTPDYRSMVFKLDGIVGDGTVNSCAPDLLKWSLALDKHTLVPASVQDEIFATGKTNDGEPHNYGFGWMMKTDENLGRVAAHSGGWPGYGTYIEKDLDKNTTIIILSNHDRPGVNLKNLLGILYDIKEKERVAITLPAEKLNEYTGEYQLQEDFSITISVKDGKIYEQATGQEKAEIFAENEDLFFLKVADARLQFERNDKKEVVGLVLLQNGQKMKGKKK